MKAQDILEALGPDSTIRRGASVYVTPRAAVAVLNECDSHDVAVLGLEGLYVSDAGVQPEMKLIRDFSISGAMTPWATYRARCNAGARAFVDRDLDRMLRELDRPDIFLEFVLKDPPQD